MKMRNILAVLGTVALASGCQSPPPREAASEVPTQPSYSGHNYIYDPGAKDLVEVPDWSAYDDPDATMQSALPPDLARWIFNSDPPGATIDGIAGVKHAPTTSVEIRNLKEQQLQNVVFYLKDYKPCKRSEASIRQEVINGRKVTDITCKLSRLD